MRSVSRLLQAIVVFGIGFLSILSPAPFGTAWAQTSTPNIVVLNSDDWGWTYYGFMQRYLRAKVGRCASTGSVCSSDTDCAGSVCATRRCASDGTACNADSECIGSFCALGRCANNSSACSTDQQCAGSFCGSADCSDTGLPCRFDPDCAYPATCAVSSLIGKDNIVSGEQYLDFEMILPDDRRTSTPAANDCGAYEGQCIPCTEHAADPNANDCTPPIHRLLTPALDALAAEGHFFPIAHVGASVCKPALATTLTGLYLGDFAHGTPPSDNTTSPILPEWLPGADNQQPLLPGHYLSMAAGKWEYGESHVRLPPLQPWDRDMPAGDSSGDAGVRAMLLPYTPSSDPNTLAQQIRDGLALERVKHFIDCTQCQPGPWQAKENAPFTNACEPPRTSDMDPDSGRLGARRCPASAQPFFLFFNPFIPHLQYRFTEYCNYFPRDPTQCALEPWKSYSVYCQSNPLFRNGDGNPVPRSCDYVEGMLRNGTTTKPDGLIIRNLQSSLENRTAEGNFLKAKADYLLWATVFDRAVDELVVYLKSTPSAEGGTLWDHTAIVYSTDNGFGITGSKAHFSEHGYRTPIIIREPNSLPAPETPGCVGQPGCRDEFAHDVDILATLRSFVGSTGDPAACPGPSFCPRGWVSPYRPDGYSEGKNLRSPGSMIRACGETNPPPGSKFRQCLFGRREGSQSLDPADGWYVLAEVIEQTASGDRDPVHLCKYYRNCGSPKNRLYDLRSDPSENRNLHGVSQELGFCRTVEVALFTLLRNTVVLSKGWDPSGCFGSAL